MLTPTVNRIYSSNGPYPKLAKPKRKRVNPTTSISNSETVTHRKPWNPSVRIDQSWISYQAPIKPKISKTTKETSRPLSLDGVGKSSTLKSQAWCLPFAPVQENRLKTNETSLDKKDLAEVPKCIDDQTTVRDSTEDLVNIMSVPTLNNTPKSPMKPQRGTTSASLLPESTHPNPMDQLLPMENPTGNSDSAFNRLLTACTDFENLISRICVWYVKARTALDTAHDRLDRTGHSSPLYPLISDYLNQLQNLLGTCLPNDLCINRWMQAMSAGNELLNGPMSNHTTASSVVFVEQFNPLHKDIEENPTQTDQNWLGLKHVPDDRTGRFVGPINVDLLSRCATTTTVPWVTVQSTQTPGVEAFLANQPDRTHCMEGDINTNCCLEYNNAEINACWPKHMQSTSDNFVTSLSPDENSENTNGSNVHSVGVLPQNSFASLNEDCLRTSSTKLWSKCPIPKKPEQYGKQNSSGILYSSANPLERSVLSQTLDLCHPLIERTIHDMYALEEHVRPPYYRITKQMAVHLIREVLVYHNPSNWMIQNSHYQESVILVEAVPMRRPASSSTVRPIGHHHMHPATIQQTPLWTANHPPHHSMISTLPAPPEELIREDYPPIYEPDLPDGVYNETKNDNFELDCSVRRKSGKRPNTPYLLWKCASMRTDSSLNDYACSVALPVTSLCVT